MLGKLREHGIVLVGIWTALVVLAFASLLLGRWALAFVSLATLGLSLLPLFVARWFALTLPVPFVVATTVFIIASIFLGEAFDFYERVWWWDLALHGSAAVGFGLIGFLGVFMLFEGDRFAAPPLALALISFCVAMMLGSIWEIFEFTMDQLFGLNMQKSGLPDTMGDLIINALGAIIASFAGYLYLQRDSAGPLGHGIRSFIEMNRGFYRRYRDRSRK